VSLGADSVAIVAGAAGQDGRLLVRRLLATSGEGIGQRVVGLVRPGTLAAPDLPCPCAAVDLADPAAVDGLVAALKPDRFFYLAAVHHSSDGPPVPDPDLQRAMFTTNTVGVQTVLAALKRYAPACRFVYAASSHMYRPGAANRAVTAGDPRDPVNYYGLTKSWAMEAIGFARTHQNLAAGAAVLFNHESPLRPESFLSRKLSVAAARIRLGLDDRVIVRNIGAYADWFDAEDAVDAMVSMADAGTPGDYAIGAGKLSGVRDLAAAAFAAVDLDWEDYVTWEADVTRPALYADLGPIQTDLGWRPRLGLDATMRRIVEHDMKWLESATNTGGNDKEPQAT
jgi:GDPmannose 4,6-dehydratase